MGVPGFVTLLRRDRGALSEPGSLKDCKLVVDCTEGMCWLVKHHYLNQLSTIDVDQRGWSMVGLGAFYRRLFDVLRAANVEPIVVYNGGRVSECNSVLASKQKHLRKSAEIAMLVLNRSPRSRTCMTELCTNVLKQVINDLSLQAVPVQSALETYPALVQLSSRHKCPVLTGHNDFILSYAGAAFVTFDDSQLGKTLRDTTLREDVLRRNGVPVSALYNHRNLFKLYPALERCSEALKTMYALLRPDFSGQYASKLNELFSKLPRDLQFRFDPTEFVPYQRPAYQPCFKRLTWLLANWPSEALRTPADVRRSLLELCGGLSTHSLVHDYDLIYDSFTNAREYENKGVPLDVKKALKLRDATASMCLEVLARQTIVNRGTYEDFNTFRSSFSLGDATRKHLMALAQIRSIHVLDRKYNKLVERELMAAAAASGDSQPDRIVHSAYVFPKRAQSRDTLRSLVSPEHLKLLARALQPEACEQLLVLLALARYAIRVGLRGDYEIVIGGEDDSSACIAQYKQLESHFYTAVFNAFMYHAFKSASTMSQEQQQQEQQHSMVAMHALETDAVLVEAEYLPKLRMLTKEIDTSGRLQEGMNASASFTDAAQIKHLVEMLNASLHGFCELNALYNYPSVQLKLYNYYDAQLIFKLVRYSQVTNARNSCLLPLDTDVNELISLHGC